MLTGSTAAQLPSLTLTIAPAALRGLLRRQDSAVVEKVQLDTLLGLRPMLTGSTAAHLPSLTLTVAAAASVASPAASVASPAASAGKWRGTVSVHRLSCWLHRRLVRHQLQPQSSQLPRPSLHPGLPRWRRGGRTATTFTSTTLAVPVAATHN